MRIHFCCRGILGERDTEHNTTERLAKTRKGSVSLVDTEPFAFLGDDEMHKQHDATVKSRCWRKHLRPDRKKLANRSVRRQVRVALKMQE